MSGRSIKKGARKTARPADATLSYGLLGDLIGYHLRRAQAVVFDDFMRAMADSRITPGQFGVLTMIQANPGISQSALARALGIERSTMVAVIDELEARALAERGTARHDRRTHALALTAKGAALVKALEPKVRRHEQRIAGDLSKTEIRRLIALLRRLSKVKGSRTEPS
ncbi:MAG TPA: MarR family transcriptional regulator [Kiloniellales bacterium]|jgi:DNA-binding MarR family transcriptional regulator